MARARATRGARGASTRAAAPETAGLDRDAWALGRGGLAPAAARLAAAPERIDRRCGHDIGCGTLGALRDTSGCLRRGSRLAGAPAHVAGRRVGSHPRVPASRGSEYGSRVAPRGARRDNVGSRAPGVERRSVVAGRRPRVEPVARTHGHRCLDTPGSGCFRRRRAPAATVRIGCRAGPGRGPARHRQRQAGGDCRSLLGCGFHWRQRSRQCAGHTRLCTRRSARLDAQRGGCRRLGSPVLDAPMP
jgi:hypothetical protein